MTEREIVATTNAPAAVGPYSQAVRVGHMVYTAGQIPLVPETGKLVDGDIEAQTIQVLKNLAAVLEAAGSSLAAVVKTTIFVTDIKDFGRVNQVYGSFFTQNPPARSTVQVAALPLGANVEIEAVALVMQRSM
jgi:2-iminobutanoate/2-iminopropanoate deaminase